MKTTPAISFLTLLLLSAFDAAGQDVPRLVINAIIGQQTTGGYAGQWVGTKGASRPISAFSARLVDPPPGLALEYDCHVAGVGDSRPHRDDEFCGDTVGGRQLEGFTLRLVGKESHRFRLQYRCHLASLGDTPTLAGGQFCGTRGQNRRLEAMYVTLERIPGDTLWQFDRPGGFAGWGRNGDVMLEGSGLVLLPARGLSNAFNDSESIPGSYDLRLAARVDGYTDSAESFGVKVADGSRRLMFQRRSDGFWAITGESGGQWVKVRPTSTFTGWGEYHFAVVDGRVTVRSRILPNGAWDSGSTWTLPAHGANDRVEVWLKGGQSKVFVDWVRLER